MTATRRVLMTVDAVGGVWQYATDLAAGLSAHGIETVLALLGPAPSDAQRATAAALAGVRLIETGLPLDWLADDAGTVRATADAVAAISTAERVNLIHLNQPALAVASMPAPVVAAHHSCVATWWRAMRDGPMPDSFGWQTSLVREGLGRADAIVCPSRAFADAVRGCYGLPASPHVVHNGRTPRVAGTVAMHDFALTAGRLWDEAKDVATLDAAAARLSVPVKAAGALVGPNGERAMVAHAHATGSLSDAALADLLAARPVFVSTARYEPFGLAVLEAAQAGCPLVLSDIPTFRELWDGAAAFVAPGDAAGFADAIGRLIGDASLRLAQGDLARRRSARFTAEAMAGAMAALYRGLATERVAA